MIFSHRSASLDLASVPSLAAEPKSPADIVYRLTACLLHEMRLGEMSSWYGWLQVLPRETIPVPILWGTEEVGGEDGKAGLRWLMGTEGSRELDRQSNEDGLTLVSSRFTNLAHAGAYAGYC
jgi:hypothetical protein